MAEAAGERYLRLLGEQELLAGQDVRLPTNRVRLTGRALVDVGALDAQTADDIARSYLLAAVLRDRADRSARQHALAVADGYYGNRNLAGMPVATAEFRGGTVPAGGGVLTLSRVSLEPDQLELAGRWKGEGSEPPKLRIRAGGAATAATFSGGGADGRWSGRWQVPATAAKLRSIDIDGKRFDLVPLTPSHTVVVEPVAEPAALVVLRRALAEDLSRWSRVTPSYRDVRGALVAVGLLTGEEPQVLEYDAIDDARRRLRRDQRRPQVGRSLALGRIPKPWRAAVDPVGGRDGDLSQTVGAVTPAVDGNFLRIRSISPVEGGIRVECEVFGDGPQLAWWATDDRGGEYVGVPDSPYGGNVLLRPALDKRATRLELIASGPGQRARIGIRLEKQ